MEATAPKCYDRSNMDEPREIPQRELRNDISAILEQVADGAHFRVTVRGKPAADLVPPSSGRRFIRRAEVERIMNAAPLDAAFLGDVAAILHQTVDEL